VSAASAKAIDGEYAPLRSPTVYTVEIDGEAVLLDEDANRLHHLNHTAALLWQCFDGQATVGDLATEISEELGLPYETVLADSLTAVRNLGAEGLLDGVDADDADDERP
jgi:hypothetical protein